MRPSEVPTASVQAVAEVQRRHPNATLSGGTGAFATVVVWFSTNILSMPMDAVTGAAFATVLATGALVIGRKGLKGVLSGMWRGGGDP